ncbi:MAG TPA: DegV family protein [Atopostipes sp.]|nr:DegV family protein [Atopostipes sp.]
MNHYIITTESGSDLPKEYVERFNVKIVPMHVTMGNETLADGSFEVKKAFDYYDETGTLPKTSGTTPDDNLKIFSKIREEHPEAHIIHIGYSAVTTVSFNAAHIAAEDFENIHLVDAKHVTIGLSAIVIATAEFINNNPAVTPKEIVAFVKEIRERTHMVFIPKTLLYLKAGGRVSNLAFHSANLLKLHPTIVVENGYLISGKKYRGSFERCLSKMLTDFFNSYDFDPYTVLVGGAPGVTPEHKETVLNYVEQQGVLNPVWNGTGAVISSHGGPGAIGIVGIARK